MLDRLESVCAGLALFGMFHWCPPFFNLTMCSGRSSIALSQCPIGLKRVTYGLHAYDPVEGECEYQLQLRRLWFVFYHVSSTDGHHSCHFLFPVSFGVKHRIIAGHTFMLQASFC